MNGNSSLVTSAQHHVKDKEIVKRELNVSQPKPSSSLMSNAAEGIQALSSTLVVTQSAISSPIKT